MKFYIKLFVISFIAFMTIIAGVFFAIEKGQSKAPGASESETNIPDITAEPNETEPEVVDTRTELEKLADSSNRVNVIAFGLNDMLADTMMLISFDPDSQHMDILSIPRDTYHHVKGFDAPGYKKMNAVYGMKEVGGVNGMKKYISEFLGIPVDYYVKVDFKAVESVVDVLGGYSVKVPFDMDYDDNWAKPALHIHFKAGQQTLSGADTVKFLRFRKNNSGSISEGDIQRIPRQQTFVKSMIEKALSSQLPSVINTIINSNYVKTDMTIETALGYAVKAASMQSDDITFYTVEGHDERIGKLDYWIHDPEALERTLLTIYGADVSEEKTDDAADTDKAKDAEKNDTDKKDTSN